jgi:hypothetical protein
MQGAGWKQFAPFAKPAGVTNIFCTSTRFKEKIGDIVNGRQPNSPYPFKPRDGAVVALCYE